MFTGPVGPVEVCFYWPEAVFGNFYWPWAIGSPLASSPADRKFLNAFRPLDTKVDFFFLKSDRTIPKRACKTSN